MERSENKAVFGFTSSKSRGGPPMWTADRPQTVPSPHFLLAVGDIMVLSPFFTSSCQRGWRVRFFLLPTLSYRLLLSYHHTQTHKYTQLHLPLLGTSAASRGKREQRTIRACGMCRLSILLSICEFTTYKCLLTGRRRHDTEYKTQSGVVIRT